MKRLVFFAAIAATSFGFGSFGPLTPSAKPYERMYIWPDGKMPDVQPQQIAAKSGEKKAPGFKAEAFRRPYIDWYAPNQECKTDLCVMTVSGGGFSSCCDASRLQPAIDRLVKAGITVADVTYRTPRPKGLPIHQSAWEDVQRAVRVVRSEAAKRGFDPKKIGATGISAGAKAVLLLATSSLTPAYEPVDEIDALPCNLLFAIPQAPAYVLTDGQDAPNSRDGDAPDVALVPELKFDAQTCPMCLFQGGKDDYSPFGSTQIYRQLRRMKIPAELHLFADRPHGFHGDMNNGDDATGWDHWFRRAEEFIRQMNYDGRLEAEVDITSRFPNDSARGSYEKEDVWPAGKTPPGHIDQCAPYIEWHFPKELKTRAVQIIFSGGGYHRNTPDSSSVAPVRRYLNARGMTVVTLKYRSPRPAGGLAKHTSAWQDLQRTIRIVRSKAAKKGLNPDCIGVMGGSAGGHLALLAATSSRHRSYWPIDKIDSIPCNVQWAIAIYSAYVLSDGVNGGNTNGGNDDCDRIVPEFSFDLDTCPILFLHGDSDKYAAMGSVKMWEQLRRMGVQCELHTFATRGHCFQKKASPGTGSYSHTEQIWEFLNSKGINNPIPLLDKIAETCKIVRQDVWYGYPRVVFEFEGHQAWIVEPKGVWRNGHPWTWTMQWAEAYVERTGVLDLLANGWRHVTIDTFSHRMDEEGLRVSRAFQKYLVESLGFAPKANLVGMSWGGFFSVRYAAANPECVSKIYLDAPLLTFSGEFGKNRGIGPWAEMPPANGDWFADARMPVNMAADVAKAGIPIFLLYGARDQTVSPQLNCEAFTERFKAAGGNIKVKQRKLFDHHPQGEDPGKTKAIADFFAGSAR